MWQRSAAEDLIAGHGTLVAEYFDVGCSRRRPWRDGPQAAALLAAAADPERGFDAIVVGEYERAFHGDQLANLAPVLAAHGVQVSHTTALGEALRSTADGDDRETTRSPFTAE